MKIEVVDSYYMLEKREKVKKTDEEGEEVKLVGIVLIDNFGEAVQEMSSLVEQGTSAEQLQLFKVEIGEEESKASPISWATIFQELHKPKVPEEQETT